MNYNQLTTDERYTLSALLKQDYSQADIARELNRNPGTISREIARNKCNDGCYRPFKAVSKTSRRRRESRRKWYTHNVKLQMAIALVKLDWSPEQVSGWLKVNKIVSIATSTIYRYVWYDKFYQGDLYKHLRQADKKRRKMYLSRDSRGVLADKRHISERPKSAEEKTRRGHWEIDTVHGSSDKHSIVTIVERKTKYTIIGKLKSRSTAELNKKVKQLINREMKKFQTITADNGTEFHGYKKIEKVTGVKFYFANPYHSWERGLNENTNGLIRQYLPKRKSMMHITQKDCDNIALTLNRRPRKTLNYKTPEECYEM